MPIKNASTPSRTSAYFTGLYEIVAMYRHVREVEMDMRKHSRLGESCAVLRDPLSTRFRD
jgi:hypothetical protein